MRDVFIRDAIRTPIGRACPGTCGRATIQRLCGPGMDQDAFAMRSRAGACA